jgi:hypothetical protein
MIKEARNRGAIRIILAAGIVLALVLGYFGYRWWNQGSGQRRAQVFAWFRDPSSHADKMMRLGEQCQGAPFIFPTDGLVGFLWGDSFRPGHVHQGIDIFPGGSAGEAPVIAAYDGYLTRLPDWKSTVIIRIPNDPLNPGRQIWTYYTHMADRQGNSFISEAFPPGTSEVFVPTGTFLGYQGDFSGEPGNPTGVHLHFSIVEDDGNGRFTNELEIRNTYDPSPYLGLALNADDNPDTIPVCETE